MSEGNTIDALEHEAHALVTCVACGRSPEGEETQGWGYFATGPRAIRRLCPDCSAVWRAGPVSTAHDDFELSWLVPAVVSCTVCGREIAIEEAEAARWGYWSSAADRFHPSCGECAAQLDAR